MKYAVNKISKLMGIILILTVLGQTVAMVSAQNTLEYRYDGKMTVSEGYSDTWEDTQWKFFTAEVDFRENITLILNYTGDLDLDLWVFIDNTTGANQKNFAWDLTDCNFDEKPTLYSCIKTYNTNETGPEFIYYENEEFTEARILYILVYAYSGVGNSTYTLQSSKPIEPVEQVQKCNLELIAWAGFGAGLGLIFILTVMLARKRGLPEDEKEKKKTKKKEKKNAKMTKKTAKKGKKKSTSSMAARKGTRRR